MRVRCVRLVTFAVGVLAVAGVENATTAQGNCLNSMFALHWAGKSDVRHMEAQPTLQQGLRLCPFYNGKVACCPRAFEDELLLAFNRWVKHLQSKVDGIKRFQLDLVRVKDSRVYVDAAKDEQVLLERALASFAPVLETLGNCFDTLLEYLAGMLCFSCDATWRDKVLLNSDGTHVTHLWINDDSNDELWQQCRALSKAAMDMHTRSNDAGLAKSIVIPFEDMTMFADKITVSEFMEKQGLLVMRGPNERALTLEPQDDTGRRLSRSVSSVQAFGFGATLHNGEINPVETGRESGFRCSVFPRRPEALSSQSRRFGVAAATLIIVAMRSLV